MLSKVNKQQLSINKYLYIIIYMYKIETYIMISQKDENGVVKNRKA